MLKSASGPKYPESWFPVSSPMRYGVFVAPHGPLTDQPPHIDFKHRSPDAHQLPTCVSAPKDADQSMYQERLQNLLKKLPQGMEKTVKERAKPANFRGQLGVYLSNMPLDWIQRLLHDIRKPEPPAAQAENKTPSNPPPLLNARVFRISG